MDSGWGWLRRRLWFSGSVRKVLGVVAAVVLSVAACSDEPAQVGSNPAPTTASSSPSPSPSLPSPPPPSGDGGLPRGGSVIFPTYQLVAYVGMPGSPALGPLDKDLDAKATKL